MIVFVFVVGFWISESARRSHYELPEFPMPCVAGWWPLGNVAIEIGEGTARAGCLLVPTDSIIAQQRGRSAEIDLTRFGGDCVAALPSARIRIERWYSAKVPQPLYPQLTSEFPDYRAFDNSDGTSGMEIFAPRNPFSGLRAISCVAGTDKCWAAARDHLLLVKWSTARSRLASGLEQDWACIRDELQAAKLD
jgi:hypothetical protein